MIRRKKNKIESLKDERGEWVHDNKVLKDMAVSFYKKLYYSKGGAKEFPLRNCFLEL